MKNLFHYLALAGLVTIVSCNDQEQEKDQGKEMGNLHVSKSKPQPGDEIQIKYSAENSEKPEASVNFLAQNNYYPEDIELKDSANAWFGTIKIPDTIKALAFNFKNGEVYEANNKKGYVMSLYDENGEEITGSSASQGIYYARPASGYDVKVEIDTALALIEKDLKKNPELVEDFEGQYSNAIMTSDPKKGKEYVEKRIAYYSKKDSLSAKNYEALVDLYYADNSQSKADSITKIAINQYPKSEIARRDYMMKVVQSRDIDKKLEYFNEYEEKIGKNGFEKNLMLEYLSIAMADEERFDEFEKYAAQIDDTNRKYGAYNSVAWNLAEDGDELDKAAKYAETSLDIIKEDRKSYKNKPEYYGERQYDRALDSRQSMVADTYALILFKQGKLDEAIKVQEEALTENSGPDMTTRYVKYLIEAENYEKAQEKASEFMRQNKANAEMEGFLKNAFAKNDNEEDFDSYLAEIRIEAKENAIEELRKNMLHEEAPTFKLNDLEGNEIALADLKGKTVILDFWATWCGPCKQSFPGMQKAVEKYQKNENVEFLFVNTWENGDNRKKDVENFIEKNDYSFHVLMDTPVAEGSRNFETISKYGINGIPTKIIIGPEGEINFKSVGYDGNNEKLLQEIGLMIDLTQENVKPEA